MSTGSHIGSAWRCFWGVLKVFCHAHKYPGTLQHRPGLDLLQTLPSWPALSKSLSRKPDYLGFSTQNIFCSLVLKSMCSPPGGGGGGRGRCKTSGQATNKRESSQLDESLNYRLGSQPITKACCCPIFCPRAKKFLLGNPSPPLPSGDGHSPTWNHGNFPVRVTLVRSLVGKLSWA